jgi:hypothetical protein
MIPIMGYVFTAVILLTLAADVTLGATWNKMYFKHGVPGMLIRIPLGLHHTNIPLGPQLEAPYASSLGAMFQTRVIDESTYAILGIPWKVKWLRLTALMHGTLFFDRHKSRVVLTGFFNWFHLGFTLIWFTIVALFGVVWFQLAFSGAFLLITGNLYLIQGYHYSQFARYAASLWARKYGGNALLPYEA